MFSRKLTIDYPIAQVFNFLNKLDVNWFLSGRSCLELVRTGYPAPYKSKVDVGIYEKENTIKHAFKRLALKRTIYFGDKLSEAVLFSGIQINLFIFMDFHQYVIETRHHESINRYRLLGYDPPIIADGVETIAFENGDARVLKNRDKYCNALFGKKYISLIEKWDGWNDPANILWEDFIQKPVRLA